MEKFILKTKMKPKGDQPTAIKKIVNGFNMGLSDQLLLGVTGSGKTLAMAKTVGILQKPTLVITHNKTLAAQLYSEFKEFFPENAVHYFVSYYDYYQPEAYVPRTDTYIEKDADINDEIDRLRNAATSSLLSRSDVLIVASVSCIYGLGSPDLYREYQIRLEVGQRIEREVLIKRLIEIQYERNDKILERGKFRVRGETMDIIPSYEESSWRINFFGDEIESIKVINPLTSEVISKTGHLVIFPAKHFVTEKERIKEMKGEILDELAQQLGKFQESGQLLEAQRLEERVRHDLEMIEETGYISGIENYSRYLTKKKPGEPPATLIDYFPKDFLCFIDESHMTIPQIRGMYNGDRSRKETLVDYGFRLPSTLDNRPLKFSEFQARLKRVLYVSATPAEYELRRVTENKIKSSAEFYQSRKKGVEYSAVAEQIIRPTGLLDPIIEVRSEKDQIPNLVAEIRECTAKNERVIVTTLTKKMAEDLTEYLAELKIKVQYIHSEVATLDRPEILRDLRLGKYDVIVGVNLLREGLDLPEVSLVAILDADKEGFLRGEQALIQTIGRAARHENGKVIMYAHHETRSMKLAITENNRRRKIQQDYNKKHAITPASIKKAIRDSIVAEKKREVADLEGIEIGKIPPDELSRILKELQIKMDMASKFLEFEKAAKYRDLISDIREEEDRQKLKKRIT